jgi:subtilisin family serine protease
MMAAVLLTAMPPASAQGAGLERKIVVFEAGIADKTAQQAVVQSAGGSVIKALPLINGLAIQIPGPAVAALQRRAQVRRIDDDLVISAIVKPGAAPSQPAQTVPWGIAQIDASPAWAYSTGAAVKLAIVDSGIKLNHADLQANTAGGINTISPKKSADDDNGHGTHVAGIAGAINNTIGVVGAAPQVDLYAVKVLNRSGTGWLSDIIEGLTWCIDNDIQVVNMSLGSDYGNDSFHEAVIAVNNAGIVQVAAAGNNGGGYGTGTGSVIYPAAYPEVIAVTAIDSGDSLADFSSYGSTVDLAAPGDSIYSTWKDGYYATLSGTSMASPHVAGVAALRLALHPTETPAQVKAALQASAEDLGDAGWDQSFGAGLVDALGAVTAP